MNSHIDDANAFLMGQWGKFSAVKSHVSWASVMHFIEVAL
jgi:hypothetical protein